ncbi:unnamed protein product [Rotaria socialis]
MSSSSITVFSCSIVRKESNPNIIILFIGESGSGKSTCINYFANYFTNSSFDEEDHYSNMKIVIPNSLFPEPNFPEGHHRHCERNVHDTSMSQTQECTAYDFRWNGQCIKIIDTPGFNDTDSHKDDQNIQKILTQASQVPFINAIVITINGTNVRLSTSIKTTLSQLRSSLPDKIFKNLFFIFTNCTEETRNFDLSLISEFKPSEERTFHMQNALFSIKDKSLLQNTKSVRKMTQTWKESVETMGEIMHEINQTSATSVQVFNDMRIRREQLIVHKENLIEKQKSLLNIMNTLQIEKERLKNASEDQQANKNFTESKRISVIDIEKKSYYSTICLRHGKVQVCHENCSLSYEPELNLHHFQQCAAANGSNCRHCACGMNDHLHSYEIPVSRLKTVEEIIQSKKAAFEQANRNIKSSSDRVVLLERVRDACQYEVNDIKDGLLTTIKELKQICSHFNFHDEMNGTIQKLRKEAKIATDFKAKQEFTRTANAIEHFINRI